LLTSFLCSGFGDVFEGSFWDSVRRRYIALAIKRLAEVALRGDELAMFRHDALACVQREINLLRAFRHPHLIRLLGYACPPNPAAEHVLRLCLVYEFASEGGLDAHLADDDKASDLTWSSRLRIASKIASVIHHLHTHVPGHPAYHRDIKSANIALTATLQPKLIDCGLAKYLPAADVGIERSVFTRVGQRPGTPIYSCPVYLQRGRYDAKSDIYSFGIVMAELLTGKLQSETQNIFHQDSPSTLQSDPRAGEWPTDLVEHLRNLIAQWYMQ
jgi:interleukin-1 receptor-associated kinase 4